MLELRVISLEHLDEVPFKNSKITRISNWQESLVLRIRVDFGKRSYMSDLMNLYLLKMTFLIEVYW
jgi:hypothetical protein